MLRGPLLAAVLLLPGCAQEPSVADCGLALHVPPRGIDEGVRYDVAEVVGDPPSVAVLHYRFLDTSGDAPRVAFEGALEPLAQEGNRTLRFLDEAPPGFLNVGDAFVLRDHPALVLQLSRGTNIVGTSTGCP